MQITFMRLNLHPLHCGLPFPYGKISAYMLIYRGKDKNTTQDKLAEPVGSPAVETDVKEAVRNPKRVQRQVRKSVQNTGIGTKLQQALQVMLLQESRVEVI